MTTATKTNRVTLTSGANPRGGQTATWDCGLKLYNVHDAADCFDVVCVIHNPSEHDLDHLPLAFLGGSFLRILPDGDMVVDPDDYNFRQSRVVILKNAAYCSTCKTEAVSQFRHDFQHCKCETGGVDADGGYDYIRHLGGDSYVDASVTAQLLESSY